MARILIVDDEVDVRSMLRQMLERADHVVIEATDGEEGIETFRDGGADMVITDILMPNRGGLAAILELRKIDEEVPIIAISGGGREGRLNFLSTAQTFPGVRTLRKPFRRRDLLAMVDEMTGSR